MRGKLVLIVGMVAAMTVGPVGLTGTASACPDPDHPCTPMPWQPVPDKIWCKIATNC